jgi:hypothetical protein
LGPTVVLAGGTAQTVLSLGGAIAAALMAFGL